MTDRIQIDIEPKFRLFPAVILAIFLIFHGQSYGQRDDEVVRVDTDLVSFEVSVSDKNGNPVKNLTANEFRVLEDGVERTIDFFQPIVRHDTARPLSIVFALDVSGSMTEVEIERLKAAMQSFISRLANYDSYFAVVSFAMEVQTLQSFTNRRDKIQRSFDKIVRDQDGLSTHAYDAVDEAVRQIARKSPKVVRGRLPRRAVILISDGFPVGDVIAPETLIERANAAETTIYSVILPSYSRLQSDKRPVITPLEASGIIDRTGGKSFYATDRSFETLFRALAEEITASYAIAFYPDAEDGRNEAVRPRKVTIESKSGFTVRQNRAEYKLR